MGRCLGPVVEPNKNTIGGSRKFGHQSTGNTNSVGGSYGVAFQLKMQAEAPFRRIKVLIHNRNTTYAVGPWVASAAVTENPNNSTDAQFCQPIVGGTTYTALATNDATQYGYRTMTFAGVQQSKLVPPGTFSPEYRTRLNITKPSASGYGPFFNAVGTIESDWLECPSVAATNGGRPWALIRLQMLDTAANPFGGRYTGAYNVQSNTDTSIDLRALSYFRDFQGVQVSPTIGQDFVNDPSLTFTKPTDLQTWVSPNVTILFDYGIPTRNVLMVGDSVTDAYPWAEIAFSQISTVTAPVNFVNCGQAARQTFQFNQMIQAYTESGMMPTDVVLPCFSVNDFNPASSLTNFTANEVIYRLLEQIRIVNALGAKVWLWTTYNGRTGYGFSTYSTQIAIINNYFRAYALANPDSCGMFDFEAAWIDGAGASLYTKDGTHPNNNGVQLGMVPVILAAWR